MMKVIFKANENWHLLDINSSELNKGTIIEIQKRIQHDDYIYSLQISDFIREFDNEFPKKDLPILIDIESFTKQFLQKSKPLETQKKWNFFKFLKEQNYLSDEFKIQDSINEYLLKIGDFIQKTIEVSDPDELDRLRSIEIPINELIYNRQRKGLAIDESLYPGLIKSTEEELYEIKNELQLNHKIYTPEKRSTQLEYLKKEGIEIKGSVLATFKNNKNKIELCDLFYKMLRTKNELSALLYLTMTRGGHSRTYPSYHGFGSISSRITLRQPGLQNLRKQTRKVIKPDIGKEFIYIDFSQFEAGILASLSEDKKLQDLYSEDIYDDINKKVWDDSRTRDDAKILFYMYMYGVEFNSIPENDYFKSFTKLSTFKDKIENEIESSGKIGSSNGNNRVLELEDKSIALSHRIQAEASLIFKEALLKVEKEIPEIDFVLPMHDAALYQINIQHEDKDNVKDKLKSAFIDVFAKRCPGINHSVSIKNFYDDQTN
ncbi:DNA polymerase [Arenibacter troitsensis]|uniref:DNA polymerase family A n=1 Tax=Arenibacter troitsensis TaxID=188872 RepID=A0A1X7KUF7_9FLAO|nr:DNA polymerase [Arenibacter troitsensis]SMG45158.1 DNA polymerase family A [Arenibacter troitsensis]